MSTDELKRISHYHLTIAQIMTRLNKSKLLSNTEVELYRNATHDMNSVLGQRTVGAGEWPPTNGWWQEDIIEALG